jgi:RNA 2',3'-cyclic 3'-phosphodiesterase
MRAFVALNLAAAETARLHAALEPLRGHGWPVRWARAAGLHLTLRFLGDIEGAEVSRIDETLRGVAEKHGPVELELGGFGAFPSVRRATVLWVGIAPDAALMALQRDADLALSRLGYGREQKPFRPHITVARLQGGARPLDIERVTAAFDYSSRITVDTMDLMRSHTDPNGARYEPLLRVALGQQADA